MSTCKEYYLSLTPSEGRVSLFPLLQKMTEKEPYCEAKQSDLLKQLEHILESDPLIDEVGFVHPSQFVTLGEEAGIPPLSSIGIVIQSADGTVESKVSEINPSDRVFWIRDHKLGISTQALLALYNAAKLAFMVALERYQMISNVHVNKDDIGDENVLSCSLSVLDILESEVMKHSKALLLLSCDFGTAWNSRKLVVDKKQHYTKFMDELLLSALVLSHFPKSECAWSHRRWVIKMVAGVCSNLQDIVEQESQLVNRLAEKSKMNYRAWNHRCWLVSYMSRGQVLHELNKCRDWAGLHVSDNSCFHYRSRLILSVLEHSWHKQDPNAYHGYYAEHYKLWKEELDWDETLIKRYIGREALWLHRRFLSLCWIKYFATDIRDGHSDHKSSLIDGVDIFLDNELQLHRSYTTIPDYNFEDYQAQAMFSATYIVWLSKQMFESLEIELIKKLRPGELETLLDKVCPEKAFLGDSLRMVCRDK